MILIFLILTSFGVNAASLAAILGSAGVAVGLAIQGSLANFAGGVLILLLKPFVVGDYIEESAHGHAGVVTKIQVFYTYLRTLEGREVVIPNGQLSNNSLVNFKGNHTAGCLIPVGVSYDTDLKMAREVLIGAIEENPYVLKEKGVNLSDINVVVGRGGLLKPIPGGTYATTPELLEDLKIGKQGQHASNLGGILASEIAAEINVHGIAKFLKHLCIVAEGSRYGL